MGHYKKYTISPYIFFISIFFCFFLLEAGFISFFNTPKNNNKNLNQHNHIRILLNNPPEKRIDDFFVGEDLVCFSLRNAYEPNPYHQNIFEHSAQCYHIKKKAPVNLPAALNNKNATVGSIFFYKKKLCASYINSTRKRKTGCWFYENNDWSTEIKLENEIISTLKRVSLETHLSRKLYCLNKKNICILFYDYEEDPLAQERTDSFAVTSDEKHSEQARTASSKFNRFSQCIDFCAAFLKDSFMILVGKETRTPNSPFIQPHTPFKRQNSPFTQNKNFINNSLIFYTPFWKTGEKEYARPFWGSVVNFKYSKHKICAQVKNTNAQNFNLLCIKNSTSDVHLETFDKDNIVDFDISNKDVLFITNKNELFSGNEKVFHFEAFENNPLTNIAITKDKGCVANQNMMECWYAK